MVSSLPFLAPVCMKKARDYRSKYSGNGDSSLQGQGSRRSAGRGRNHNHSDHIKLSNMSKERSLFARSTSQELILKGYRDAANKHSDNFVDASISPELVPDHGKATIQNPLPC
ncbi:hypothetical protein CDD82_6448 [Ophiocordyceps australis]|uniref:Uncharacterized protein n=1 Tax=Ophiocordyceps australis TaxID=1399860 RepID=A0A2C5Y0C7_9HYPO|nr:hypothetical protein CDD82_6448 [Ophiocordyceps australis]